MNYFDFLVTVSTAPKISSPSETAPAVPVAGFFVIGVAVDDVDDAVLEDDAEDEVEPAAEEDDEAAPDELFPDADDEEDDEAVLSVMLSDELSGSFDELSETLEESSASLESSAAEESSSLEESSLIISS